MVRHKASGKAKEAVENVKEKANDVIDKFSNKALINSPSNLALMYSMVYEGLFVYISK